MKKILEFLIHPELRPNRQIGIQTWMMKYSFIYIVYLFALISVEINDHLEGCEESEGSDDDQGVESDDKEEENCCHSSSEHSSELGSFSSDEYGENQDDEESEKFWNPEQLEILTSALPSFHFLPRTTMEKVVTELEVKK